jgi:hypothetical protein
MFDVISQWCDVLLSLEVYWSVAEGLLCLCRAALLWPCRWEVYSIIGIIKSPQSPHNQLRTLEPDSTTNSQFIIQRIIRLNEPTDQVLCNAIVNSIHNCVTYILWELMIYCCADPTRRNIKNVAKAWSAGRHSLSPRRYPSFSAPPTCPKLTHCLLCTTTMSPISNCTNLALTSCPVP